MSNYIFMVSGFFSLVSFRKSRTFVSVVGASAKSVTSAKYFELAPPPKFLPAKHKRIFSVRVDRVLYKTVNLTERRSELIHNAPGTTIHS